VTATTRAQQVLVDLVARGATDVVVSPGSRSGPLARAAAAADAQGLLRLHVRIDEREAAFLALGMAKVSGRITAVVTTSGTAVANLHPAMLEALHSRVPLVAVTADRPARLRGTGANQTTVQPGIFGGIVTVTEVGDIPMSGPGHLNLELDEPLSEAIGWEFGTPAPIRRSEPAPPASVELVDGPRTVVVAGDDSGPRARVLAERANWPLLAEPSSGARTGSALTSYRLLLGHAPLADRIERVVSFGHPTLSRAVTSLLAADVEVVHVGDQSTFPVPAGPNVRFVDDAVVREADDPTWLAEWQSADARVTAAVARLPADPLQVARTVWAAVPPEGLLVVGSSSSIRDLDVAAAPFTPGQRRKVMANRGLAGIDGMLSTAIGAALARPSSRALAYVGDLTFLHGSNGLLIGPGEPRPDLTIVVVNDDGGGIFASLEQGAPEYADSFERVFATPTGADLGRLCTAVGVSHVQVDPAHLAADLNQRRPGIHVVEVPLRRDGRRELAGRLVEVAARALAEG
jgi:2-succinyl-5-enolpyruvyl-6-hydroxy-3-cyclohexene-1-carboxylate synthase